MKEALDVSQNEGCCIGGRGIGMLAWAKKEEETMMIITAVACSNSEFDRRLINTMVMCLRTWIWIGMTHVARGSFNFHTASMHWMWMSILSVGVRWGSWTLSVFGQMPAHILQPIEPR